MRIRFESVICFFALLTCASSLFAKTHPLDVALEGPWIYLEDAQFDDGSGHTKPVLVVMAPNSTGHNLPIFSTGRGFQILPSGHVYCLGDTTTCAPGTPSQSKLVSGNYPDLRFVKVKTMPGWKWYQSITQDSWILILPMPDSASNNGVDHITLEPGFAAPAVPNGTSETIGSIGMYLHYADWDTSKLTLFRCADHKVDRCDNPQAAGAPQDNYGTLSISMTVVPETDTTYYPSRCEYHVRAAYHAMILFLDSTPLNSGRNRNQSQGYIDLRQIDDSYDPSCYYCDPQEPNTSCPPMPMAEGYAATDAKELLGQIVANLRQIDSKDKEGLNIEKLNDEHEKWTGAVPDPSQLAQIQGPLHQSLQGVQKLYQQESRKDKAPLVAVRDQERRLIAYAIRTVSATSGKDCRVAQMLVDNN